LFDIWSERDVAHPFTAGAWLLFFLMSAFAVMTWRERLARHAFMLGLVALVSLVGVLAERYFWH
jgi:hypothetical protein